MAHPLPRKRTMAEDPEQGEGFAGRWSRLKSEARVRLPDEPSAGEIPHAEQANESGASVVPPAPEEERAELPPIETLTKDSDYRLFMRKDVTSDLRAQALRKLWSLDPHFATIDISECHSIDFNAVPCFPEGLANTIYRVGSGMVEAVEEIERAEAAEKTRLAAAEPKRVDSGQEDSLDTDDPPAKST